MIALHLDEEVCAFYRSVDKGCDYLQAARRTAKEIDSASEEIEQRSALLFHAREGDGGLLVETQDRFITQADSRPALFLDPHGIAGAERIV